LRRIFRGLKHPKGSPEYEYSRYALLSLFGPYVISSIASALVILLSLLFSIATDAAPPPPDLIFTVDYVKPGPAEIPIEPERPADLLPSDMANNTSDALPGLIEGIDPVEQLYSSNPNSTADSTDIGVGGNRDTAMIPFAPAFSPSVRILKDIPFNSRKDGVERTMSASGNGPGGVRRRPDGTGETSEDAVLRALRWLKKYQEADGSWNAKSGGGPGYEDSSEPALTGLALLAFLAHGETLDSKEFGPGVEKGIRWLVDNQDKDGHFKKRDKHDYSQPIAAYALCEAFGMTQVPDVKVAAKKAVDVLIRGQHACGSWNYNCDTADRNDTSYSGWCAQALKAARMAGLDNEGLDLAMKRSVEGFRLNFRNGVFAYESRNTGDKGYLTSVGVLCMQILGSGKDPAARTGMDWLNQNATCDWAAPWGENPIYDWYYMTQASFHTGGNAWKKWDSQFSTQLVANQKIARAGGVDGKDIGYWDGLDKYCKSSVYNTTLCTLMLEVYYRYLPTYNLPKIEAADTSAASSDDIKVEVTN
jgi:hypothetical protein